MAIWTIIQPKDTLDKEKYSPLFCVSGHNLVFTGLLDYFKSSLIVENQKYVETSFW